MLADVLTHIPEEWCHSLHLDREGFYMMVTESLDKGVPVISVRISCVPHDGVYKAPYLTMEIAKVGDENEVKVTLEDQFDSKSFDTYEEEWNEVLTMLEKGLGIPLVDRFSWL